MRTSWIIVVAIVACRPVDPPPAQTAAVTATPFLKGQLHVHSNHSGDSDTPPARVVSWYREHHFDFIVFTDHNAITAVDAAPGDMLVFPGVELTQNLPTCDPPPPADTRGCLLHVNALFVTDTQPLAWRAPSTIATRLALYTEAIDLAGRLGGIAQLNHPNFHWGADAALIGQLVQHGLRLFEVANQSSDVANDGDATHPSTEALWDAVLTAGGHVYGVATDDAHQYDDADAVRARGEVPDTGDHGWVMVHASRDRAAIRDALLRGDFYASNGVELARIDQRTDPHGAALVIEVAAASPGDHDFAFIGAGGRELARSRGRSASFPLAAVRGSYVRATVTDARGRRAWIQPVWP